MLKFFFWLLLLTNGALFAYHQGYLDVWFAENREPGRVARQLNPDQIKLQPADGARKPAAGPGKPEASQPDTDVDALPAVVAVSAVADKKPEVLACTEFGNFSDADAKRFQTQLTPLALGTRLTRRTITENGSHLVYIPPQGSKENAEKKVGELRRLGVTDFFLIQDNSPMRWSISLGIFSTEAAAKARLAELSKQGVRTARLGARNASTKVAFQLREIDAATREKFDKIKTAYPQQEERSCS